MININDVAENILSISRKRGCRAQISIGRTESNDICVRKGEIERLLTSVAISTGVRLFKGKRSIIIALSGEDFGDMETKINNALDDIEYLSEDPFRRLLEPDEFAGDQKDLNLRDESFDAIEIPKIKDALIKIENSALAFDKRISASDTADFSASRSSFTIYTTEGLKKSYLKSYYMFGYTAVAEESGLKERDSWSESRRHYLDLPSTADLGKIGEIAAERTIKRLGGKKIKSGDRKVVFSWRTADNLLDMMCDAMDGEAIVLKNSFLVDRVGEKLFPDHIHVIDDPLMPKYIGSYPFDGEGMNGVTKAVIDKGTLTTYLQNSYSAGKLNMKLTGNASHITSSAPHITIGNIYLQGGKGTMNDLLHEMKEGLLVEELFSSGINEITGDFSFGCSGFLVENGVITMPVKEITIAGNLIDLYKDIIAIADDNPWRSSITSPSILISNLSVAGM